MLVGVDSIISQKGFAPVFQGTVSVTSIVSQRDFGTIFNGTVQHSSDSIIRKDVQVKTVAKTCLGCPAVGELWEIAGLVITSEKWGEQISAQRAMRVRPTGKLITSFLAAHAPGVGLVRAEALWEAFGLDLKDILSDEANIPKIAAVIAPNSPNLAPRLAGACVNAWKEAEAETQTMVWLATQGIEDAVMARRIAKILGIDAVVRLCANPYCLVPLMPWNKVDVLALKLFAESAIKTPTRDTRRLVGACDAVVKAHIADGHTAGTLQSLTIGLAKLLKLTERSPIITTAIEAGKRHGAFVFAADGWRAPGCAKMEEQTLQRLRQIAASVSPVQVPDKKTLERLLSGVQAVDDPCIQNSSKRS